jgi:acetyl-CoA carboxylase biotin carboxyl carrier protein
MGVDIADLQRLIDAFEQSDWEEVHLRGENFEIRLSTKADGAPALAAPSAAKGHAGDAPPTPTANGHAAEAPAPSPAATSTAVAEGTPVRSPSAGIFWRAPSPTSPPFVEVGDDVTPESTLCIVEVMKLMTHVGAATTGRVAEILVANGEAVQKDQPLFLLAER